MNRVSAGTLLLLALVVGTTTTAFFLFVDLDYIRWVDNDPLTDAVRVVRFEGDEIELADGRVIELFDIDDEFEQELRGPDPRVEVLQSAGSDLCRVFFRRRRFICGLSPPSIDIPLIPRDTPRYEKSFAQPGTLCKRETPH